MKKVVLLGLLFGSLNFAKAIDAPASLIGANVLNGNYAYLWSVPVTDASLPIDSASITFTDVKMTAGGNGNSISVDFGSFLGINNVRISGNYSHYIGTAPDNDPNTLIGSVKRITDNDYATDAFKYVPSDKIIHLGTELFPSLNVLHTWTYFFTADQLEALNGYVALGNWGFEIDPDCHFTVGGISFNYTQGTRSVPDSVGTLSLLGLTMTGLIAFRRKLCFH